MNNLPFDNLYSQVQLLFHQIKNLVALSIFIMHITYHLIMQIFSDLPPPTITISSSGQISGSSVQATVGQQLQLTCIVTVVKQLIVTPTVSWTGVSVPSDSNVTVNGNQVLNEITLSNVQTSHGGVYTCHANRTLYSVSVMKNILLVVKGMLTFKDTCSAL